MMGLLSVEKNPPQHGQRIIAYQKAPKGWIADEGYVIGDELEIHGGHGCVDLLGNYDYWIPFPMPEDVQASAKELAEYKSLIKVCNRCKVKECAEFVYPGKDGLEYCQTCYDDMFPREWK